MSAVAGPAKPPGAAAGPAKPGVAGAAAAPGAEPVKEKRAYSPGEKATRKMIKQAKRAESDGNLAAAVRLYAKAISKNPRNAKLFLLRAACYEKLFRINKAIRDYTSAMFLDQGNAKIYTLRGRAYTTKRKYNRAIIDHTKAIEIDPTYSTAYDHRGVAKFRKGLVRAAVHDFKRAIKKEHKFVNAYFHLAHALRRQGKADQAEKCLYRAKRLAGLEPVVTEEDWPEEEDAEFFHAMVKWNALTRDQNLSMQAFAMDGLGSDEGSEGGWHARSEGSSDSSGSETDSDTSGGSDDTAMSDSDS